MDQENRKRRPPNLNAIVYFESVARHSRVNLAAAELSISPSAVSQQIKALEEQMGVLLFRRVKRRLVLTEQGERLYHSATEALGILRTAQSRVSSRSEHRSLRIRVSATFGVRWLGPRLAEFIAGNPNLDLHVDATSELTDFEKEVVDLEIRYGLRAPEGLYAAPLIEERVLPLCAPRIAAMAREAGGQAVLERTRLIHTVKAAISWREWAAQAGVAGLDTAHGLKFDRSSMSLQAACDGAGVVLETATLAMNELRSGSLVPLLPELGSLTFPTYWLICPPRHLNRRAVKIFRAWVEENARLHDAEKSLLLETLGAGMVMPYSARPHSDP